VPYRAVAVLVAALLCASGAAAPAPAQEPVDMARVSRYVSSLDTSFWEQAWARHLQEEAGADGTLDWNYDDRQRLSTFTDRYQRLVADANGFWTNLQVQDYLQRRLLAVQPNPMMPRRPGAFAVRVLRTSVPNALAFSDGTILLTTGLLTTLRMEAELEALLAHEVAHITLDHALSRYQSGQKRSRTRNLLGVLGKVAGGVASAVTPLDIGDGAGLPETAAYGLEDGLADRYLDPRVIKAAGLAYTEKQEAAANRLAQRWLLSTDRPPAALFPALRKARRAATSGSATHRVSFLDSHPVPDNLRSALSTAVENAGSDASALAGPVPSSDAAYDTRMAAVLEHEAEIDIAARRYRSALAVLDRTIQAQWTAPKAYLLKVIAVRNTATGPADHARALALLDTAAARTEARRNGEETAEPDLHGAVRHALGKLGPELRPNHDARHREEQQIPHRRKARESPLPDLKNVPHRCDEGRDGDDEDARGHRHAAGHAAALQQKVAVQLAEARRHHAHEEAPNPRDESALGGIADGVADLLVVRRHETCLRLVRGLAGHLVEGRLRLLVQRAQEAHGDGKEPHPQNELQNVGVGEVGDHDARDGGRHGGGEQHAPHRDAAEDERVDPVLRAEAEEPVLECGPEPRRNDTCEQPDHERLRHLTEKMAALRTARWAFVTEERPTGDA